MRPDYFVIGIHAVEGERRYTTPAQAFAYLRAEATAGYYLPDVPVVFTINLKETFVMTGRMANFTEGYALASVHLVWEVAEIADPFGPAGCIEIRPWRENRDLCFGWVFYGYVPNPSQWRLRHP